MDSSENSEVNIPMSSSDTYVPTFPSYSPTLPSSSDSYSPTFPSYSPTLPPKDFPSLPSSSDSFSPTFPGYSPTLPPQDFPTLPSSSDSFSPTFPGYSALLSYGHPPALPLYGYTPPPYVRNVGTFPSYAMDPTLPIYAPTKPSYAPSPMDFGPMMRTLADVSLSRTKQVSKTMNFRSMMRSQTDVSLSLTKQILETIGKDSNMVFSPLSIQIVLNLLAAGSNGETLHQLLSFLKSESKDKLGSFSSDIIPVVLADGSAMGGPRLCFANGLWIDKSLHLEHAFKQIVDNVYKAACNQVDFLTQSENIRQEVNIWVENVTKGLIEQVLAPGIVNSFTRLIFANALYFKGAWTDEFDASRTKDYEFYLTNGSSVKAPFMTSYKRQYISVYNGFKVLGLPYEQGEDIGRRFTMYIFLPDAKAGLKDLVDQMSSESGFLEDHLPRKTVKVGEFLIPRFKISFDFKACEVVKALGLVLPFSDNPDFTGMVSGDQNLSVSNIIHKSSVEVNEEGTEAAAVTFMTFGAGCARYPIEEERIDFVADHAFLFMIREDVTGALLFIGHLLNPLA